MKSLQVKGNNGRTFYIDGENNVESLLTGIEVLCPDDSVVVFHRENLPAQAKKRIVECKATKEWICCTDHGIKNSLDFQLVAEVSLQVRERSPRLTYIVSQDKGFVAAANYLNRALFEGESIIEVHPSVSSALGSCTTRAIGMIEGASDAAEAASALSLLLGSRARSKLVDWIGKGHPNENSYEMVAI